MGMSSFLSMYLLLTKEIKSWKFSEAFNIQCIKKVFIE